MWRRGSVPANAEVHDLARSFLRNKWWRGHIVGKPHATKHPDPHLKAFEEEGVTGQRRLPTAWGQVRCVNLPPASPSGECDTHRPPTGQNLAG